MKAGKLLNKWGAALLATLLMISLFAVPVFADDGHNHEEAAGLDTATIVWIIVGAVLLVVAVVLGIKFREKIAKGLRVYKSEFKKVSWLSWEQTRKSTLIVLIVLIVCAVVICLMDLALGEAIKWLILRAFKG